MNYKSILKKAGITGVKSYASLYGTKINLFAVFSKGQAESSWYCKIDDNGYVHINTKYYGVPDSVKVYNATLQN